MTVNGWIQILLYMAIIFAITKPTRQLHVSCIRGGPATFAALVRGD